VSLSINAAAAAAAAAAGRGYVGRWRHEDTAKLMRYFSDFMVDWTPTQMNQNVIYGTEWATRRLRLALIYLTFIYRPLLANACIRCLVKLCTSEI